MKRFSVCLTQLRLVMICFLLIGQASADQKTLDAIQMQRQGLIHLIQFMDRTPEIFNREPDTDTLLNRQQKQVALDTWQLYLDYMSTLNLLSDHTKPSRLVKSNPDLRNQLHALAFTAHYRFGLEFISRVKQDAELVKWYNLEHPEAGLPKNFYRRFSNQMLSDFATDQFDDFSLSYVNERHDDISGFIEEDRRTIAKINRLHLLTSNSASFLKRSLYNTYYPMQKGIARGMGKVKVWRIGKTLITPAQALAFSRNFEPGDFYLTRKEWRLTNVGIPGFWTHSAMFIGTPTERALYFNTPEINAWVSSMGAESYEDLLRQTSRIYAEHPGFDDGGDIRVIEALDAGVIFNSIETSLDADGAAVFRPMVSRLEKAKAIYASFLYTGQPYDFHFDFDSDNALVCSELIYKAYQPSADQTGLEFPLYRAVGNKMLTPSEIARWYDETVGTPEQKIELVMFIDSNEKDGVAFQSTKEAFIGSWKRPDWYLFQQPERTDDRVATN